MKNNDDVIELDPVTVTASIDDTYDGNKYSSSDSHDSYVFRDRHKKPSDRKPKEPQERVDPVYSGFPTGKGFYIVIHEYKETIIGHTNVEFVHNAKRDGWFGANIEKINLGNITGGIHNEYGNSKRRITDHKDKHVYKIIEVSQQDYNKALSQAQRLYSDNKAGKGDYDIIGKDHNCVDFVIDTLKTANVKNAEKEVATFMRGTTLANGYAEVVALMARGVARETAYNQVFSNNSEFKQFKHVAHSDIPKIIGKYSSKSDFKASIIVGGSGNDTYHIDLSKQSYIISDNGGKDTLNIKQDSSKLLFRKSYNDLLIIDRVSQNNLIIQDWFKTKTENVSVQKWRGGLKRKWVTVTETKQVEDNAHKLERIVANGKQTLSYDKVGKLVEAMAIIRNDGGFAIPESIELGRPNPALFGILEYIRNSWEEIK
ncbi:TPA: hypothetical protein ACK3JW_000235 [Mannheimia haemolytica]